MRAATSRALAARTGTAARPSTVVMCWAFSVATAVTGAQAPHCLQVFRRTCARQALAARNRQKLDGRLVGQLPHYDGYEWMQAGADLILVAVATGIIYEVLNGAFD